MRLPTDFSHHRATLDSISNHYVREGAGEPLLLLHGWPGFRWEWHRNIGPLARDFDVIVPDMRGFGESDKPPFDQIDLYHMDRAVEDTRILLDRLGLTRAYLVGHDFGAVLAHKFLRRYPERVAKTLIANPIVPGLDELYLSPWNDLDRTISAVPVLFLQGMADVCIPSRWSDLVTRWYTNFSIEYVPDRGTS